MKTLSDFHSMYQANANDWRRFLNEWTGAEKFTNTDDSFIPSDMNLPKSYRDFLIATGGKEFICPNNNSFFESYFPHDESLFELNKINTIKNISSDVWDFWMMDIKERIKNPIEEIDSLYYVYGHDQMSYAYKEEYIESLLIIGYLCNGMYIGLNSKEKTADFEWEAWIFCPHGGANRYRCFAELMVDVYWSDTSPDIDLTADDFNKTCARYIYSHYRVV